MKDLDVSYPCETPKSLSDERQRLISRARLSYSWNKPAQLVFDLLTEFSDHLAVRKILQGVKGRVKGKIEPMAQAKKTRILERYAVCF